MTPEAVTWLREQITVRRDTAKDAADSDGNLKWWNSLVMASGDHTIRTKGNRPVCRIRPGDSDAEDGRTLDPHAVADFIALNDPAQILADCEAHLAICDLWAIWNDRPDPFLSTYADAVRAVAGAYRDWPGWDEHFGTG